jgi:hypothetical protein
MIINTPPNGKDVIMLNHPRFKATFTFGAENDKIFLISNQQIIDKIYFYGFKGEIYSPLFDEIYKRPEAIQAKLFAEFLKSIKYSLLKKVLSLTHQSPNIIRKHRRIFMQIAAAEDFGAEMDRYEIGEQIPVLLLGEGWKTINQLHNKNVYFEVLTTNNPSSKAERASSMGYDIICAGSVAEQTLLEKMVGARNLSQLPESKLKDFKLTPKTFNKYSSLMNQATGAVNLLTKTESDMHTRNTD